MGENSEIEWTDHTFNPWIGCTNTNPGCEHCYAEAIALRFGTRSGEIIRATAPQRAHGASPISGVPKGKSSRARMVAGNGFFCASMADVFANQVPREWRQERDTIRPNFRSRKAARDELAMAGGEGSDLLRRIKYRAVHVEKN